MTGKEEGTYHDFNHHAPINACEAACTRAVDELAHDSRDEEHGNAHSAQVCEDARCREYDHSVCVAGQYGKAFEERMTHKTRRPAH